MIAAIPLAEVIVHDDETICAWPDCSDQRAANGYCFKHDARVKRGALPGCENAWDRLVTAALAISAAESDRQYDAAAHELAVAARKFRGAARGARAWTRKPR